MKKLFLLGFIFLISLSFAQAAYCGGDVQCNCGDTVNQDYVMEENLLNCAGTWGLTVNIGVTLDCNGHTISGLDIWDSYGIYLSHENDVTVKNCHVKDFMHNVLFVETSSTEIVNNTFQGGLYGMSLTQASTGNLIWNNNFFDNSVENAQETSDSQSNSWNIEGHGNHWHDFGGNPDTLVTTKFLEGEMELTGIQILNHQN